MTSGGYGTRTNSEADLLMMRSKLDQPNAYLSNQTYFASAYYVRVLTTTRIIFYQDLVLFLEIN